MDLPMVFMPAGPMMRAHHAGQILGSGSDAWKYWAEKEAGTITNQQWNDIEAGIARSNGTCMTMGTASTMTSIAEALGLTLPGASSIPAADAAHPRIAAGCGRRIVDMIWEDLKPSDILDRRSFENALIVHNALAGSDQCRDPPRGTCGARGRRAEAHGFDDFAQKVPVIANLAVGRLAHGGLLHLPAGSWTAQAAEGLLHLDARMRCVTAT
jgi:dihydroxy-acid dehydratase